MSNYWLKNNCYIVSFYRDNGVESGKYEFYEDQNGYYLYRGDSMPLPLEGSLYGDVVLDEMTTAEWLYLEDRKVNCGLSRYKTAYEECLKYVVEQPHTWTSVKWDWMYKHSPVGPCMMNRKFE